MPAILSKTLVIGAATLAAAALTLATGGTAGVVIGIAALVAVVGEVFYDNIIKAAGSILGVVVEKLKIMTANTESERIQQWLELAGTAIMIVQQKLYRMEHGHSYVKTAVRRGICFFRSAIKAITRKIYGSSGGGSDQPWNDINEEAERQLAECLPASEFPMAVEYLTGDDISSEVDAQERIEELESELSWYRSLGVTARRSASCVAI